MEIKTLSQKVPTLSNTPEIDSNIRNNFVEDKDAHSNKTDFVNFNIPTYS